MELAFALGMLWMDGQASTPNILALFVKQGVLIGLFALFIEAGPTPTLLALGRRLDLTVEISRYGKGRFSLSLAPWSTPTRNATP